MSLLLSKAVSRESTDLAWMNTHTKNLRSPSKVFAVFHLVFIMLTCLDLMNPKSKCCLSAQPPCFLSIFSNFIKEVVFKTIISTLRKLLARPQQGWKMIWEAHIDRLRLSPGMMRHLWLMKFEELLLPAVYTTQMNTLVAIIRSKYIPVSQPPLSLAQS